MKPWLLIIVLLLPGTMRADDLPQLTSLSDPECSYKVSEKPYAILMRNGVKAVVVDNQAVADDVLPAHRAGYSGLAYLGHSRRTENLFVPSYAGLNYEHIHDGTKQDRKVLFEPRNAPMQLRLVDQDTVELYQAASPHYGLESCLRYQMLKDGTLEMTLECVPRKRSYTHGYIGLFWASYIHQPESLDVHFQGRRASSKESSWIQSATPSHGELATHLSLTDMRTFKHDPDFPLSLVFNRSNYRYSQPWYYGVSHQMAWVQMFRPQDQVRLTQSPSGGGKGNPAWDFQYLIPDYQVGKRYQLVMRGLYVPFESREQVERVTATHRQALGIPGSP
ncbi:MAG: hypothetical protein VB857_06910 [Pirellulaceae bacterium]